MSRELQGVGIGLRTEFAEDLLRSERQVDWIELVPESWMRRTGVRRARVLREVADRWTVVPHSVSLSIGGPDPWDQTFLADVLDLIEEIRPPFWSDHLAYSRVNGVYLHDLLPLPFCEEAVDHFAKRASELECNLDISLVIENPTFYAVMPGSTMTESEFLRATLEASGCGVLLDLNNVYVNSLNHHFDPYAFLESIALDRVRQIHLAGHARVDDIVVDTHGGPVPEPVLELYRHTITRAGHLIPTLIEWDANLPPLDRILDEADKVRSIATETLQCSQPKGPSGPRAIS